jgi:hypothetical protein
MKEEMEAQRCIAFMRQTLKAIEGHIGRTGVTAEGLEVLRSLDRQIGMGADWIFGRTNQLPPGTKVELPEETWRKVR